MTNQVTQPNRGKNKIARSDLLSVEALGWLLAGVCGIPFLGMGLVLFFDPGFIQYIESLPKAQGLLYSMGGMALLFSLPIVYVLVFPALARRIFPGVSTLKLYENGLAVFVYGQEDKFHQFEDFDRILIEQSEERIALEFFRGEGHWMFSLIKKGNGKNFARVAQLATTFPQGRPKQGPPTQWRTLW